VSKFVSNVIKLGSATLLGQILGIMVTPILTRLYLPEDFGIFQLFFSIVGLIAIISCLSYDSAIQLPKNDEDAANIVILCIILIFITTFLTTIFLFFFSSNIEQIMNTPGLSTYLIFLPLAIISISVSIVLVSWLARKDEFGTIAKANLYSSISGKAVSLGYGFISPSPFGLILGTIINDATIAIISLRKIKFGSHFSEKLSFEKIKELAIRYKKFPQYNTGANLAGSAAVQIIPILLAFLFSTVVVGYYAIAYTIMILPSKLVGNSISSVFYRKACEEKNLTGSIHNVVKAVHTRLISIGIFSCLIIMIIGPELFKFALGPQWETAGVYAQIMAPWIFVTFISTPLRSIFNVLEMQGANFWFNFSQFITRIVVLLISGIFGNPTLGLILLSGTGVIFWSWMNMFLLKSAGVSIHDAVLEIFQYLLFGLLICLPLIIAKYFSAPSLFLIVIALALSILYYAIIFSRDPQLKNGMMNSLKNILGK